MKVRDYDGEPLPQPTKAQLEIARKNRVLYFHSRTVEPEEIDERKEQYLQLRLSRLRQNSAPVVSQIDVPW